jgi:hypothetical protein
MNFSLDDKIKSFVFPKTLEGNKEVKLCLLLERIAFQKQVLHINLEKSFEKDLLCSEIAVNSFLNLTDTKSLKGRNLDSLICDYINQGPEFIVLIENPHVVLNPESDKILSFIKAQA